MEISTELLLYKTLHFLHKITKFKVSSQLNQDDVSLC